MLRIDQPQLAGETAFGTAFQGTRHATAANEGEMPGCQQALEVFTIHVGSRFGTWQPSSLPGGRGEPGLQRSNGRSSSRETMCRWISEVPSQIRSIRALRQMRSTGRFIHQAHAAEDLHRFVGDLAEGLAGEQLGHAGLAVGHGALVHLPGGVQGHQLGGTDLRGHVGELEGNALVAADRLAELLAIGRPAQRQVEGALGLADTVGGDHHPSGGEPGVGHFQPLPTSPSTLEAGTRQSSKKISWCGSHGCSRISARGARSSRACPCPPGRRSPRCACGRCARSCR